MMGRLLILLGEIMMILMSTFGAADALKNLDGLSRWGVNFFNQINGLRVIRIGISRELGEYCRNNKWGRWDL